VSNRSKAVPLFDHFVSNSEQRGWNGEPEHSRDLTEQKHRYVIEAPAQLSREEWEKEYSLPAPAETKCDRTPSDESLVLSNE
jgi:hypothetical protein